MVIFIFLFIIYFDIYIYKNNFKTFFNKKYPFIAYTLIILIKFLLIAYYTFHTLV